MLLRWEVSTKRSWITLCGQSIYADKAFQSRYLLLYSLSFVIIFRSVINKLLSDLLVIVVKICLALHIQIFLLHLQRCALHKMRSGGRSTCGCDRVVTHNPDICMLSTSHTSREMLLIVYGTYCECFFGSVGLGWLAPISLESILDN